MAVANYEANHGHYPPAYILGPDGKPWHSWRILILPYIEGQAIYDQYDFNEPWDGPNNRKLAGLMPQIYRFSSHEEANTQITNYLAVVGQETLWPGEGTTHSDEVTDGLGQTIQIVENSGLGVHWMEPRDLDFATMSFELGHPDGISSWYKDPAIVTANGSVLRLKPGLQPETLRALLTIRGGERLGQNESGQWEVIPDGRNRPPKE